MNHAKSTCMHVCIIMCKISISMIIFIMQEPLERKLGQRLNLAHRVSRPYLKVVHDCVCEVPLLQSLKQLLKQPLVFEEVGVQIRIKGEGMHIQEWRVREHNSSLEK